MPSAFLHTHTRWSEAPRIRHQTARLLRDVGFRVLVSERAESLLGAPLVLPHEVEPGIWAARPRRFMHHQLRLVPPQHWLQGWQAARDARRIVDAWSEGGAEHIVNFAHDGWFLRREFPDSSIRTVIHDDFEAQSRLPFSAHIAYELRRTCEVSDAVFAVSEPLCDRLSKWCRPALLLPWSTEHYRPPTPTMQGRDSVLFWGFIDNALDLGMIERVARSLRARSACGEVLLVGPTQTRGARARISVALAAIPNLRIMDPKPLPELPLERMFAALLPYRRSKATDAVTLANKSMRMLACGLPLLITGMPNFLRREFIVRADEECDPARALERCRLGFLRWQPAIRDFCAENGPEAAIRTLGFA